MVGIIFNITMNMFCITILSSILVSVGTFLGLPVLLKQKAPSKNERNFKIYKSLTMTDEKDENDCLVADETRLTGFGKFRKAKSLDDYCSSLIF